MLGLLFFALFYLVFLAFLLSTEAEQVRELEAAARRLLRCWLVTELRRCSRGLLDLLAEALPEFLGATEEVVLLIFLLVRLLLFFGIFLGSGVRSLLGRLGSSMRFQLSLYFVLLPLDLHLGMHVDMRHHELLDLRDDSRYFTGH